jgi:F420-dependent oxidoreductase-like protein
MRVSLSVTDFSWPGTAAGLAEVAAAADEAGLDTLWVADHLIQAAPDADPDGPMLEACATLGWLAARTRRIRLGAMVSPASLRPAALLVKAVTTLDVLSDGRAWLGIGAGYHEAEAAAMGLPLPPIGERFERLEDTLALAHRMWCGDGAPFTGRRIRLTAPHTSPRPVSRPQPPILIGGMGETRTLPLVARYADACNLFDIPDGGRTIRHKLAVLDRACEAIGRPPGEVERTVSTRLGPGESADSFAERCAALAALGIDHAIVIRSGPWTPDAIAVLQAG